MLTPNVGESESSYNRSPMMFWLSPFCAKHLIIDRHSSSLSCRSIGYIGVSLCHQWSGGPKKIMPNVCSTTTSPHGEFSDANPTAEWLFFFHFVHQFCISWAHLSKQLNWYQFEPQINPRHPRQSNRFELTATAYDSVWTHENETLPCRHGHTFHLFLKLVRLRTCGFNTSVLSFLSFCWNAPSAGQSSANWLHKFNRWT